MNPKQVSLLINNKTLYYMEITEHLIHILT
jgi:hypothetical protein